MQKLREYQERSISELRNCFKKGKKRVVVVLPTGSGKTSVAAGIAYNAKACNKKIIFLAHRQELVYQAHTRFAQWGINAGIIMPPHKNYGQPVNIASIQTLIRREHYDADIVFVDECLDGKSLILLPDGTQKTIHSVVSDKIQYIATEIDGEIVPGKVVRWIKNPRNAQKILKIKVKNRHGRFSLLSATANHGIFLREGKKVRADELQVGDAVGYCYRVSAGQGHFIRGDKLSRKSNCGKHGQGNPKWRGGRTVCGAIGKQYYYLTKSGLLDNIDLLSRLSSISVDIIRGYLRQWWSLLPDRLRENRLIMSLSIGRWLETAEQVHHKDEDRLNNYISNLEIMSGSKHSATNGNQYVSRLNSMVFEDAEIVQITEVLNPTSYVYNLEIESTHKYFANGILVANCHHVNSKSYTTILKRYPNAYVIGLTATPFRTDGKPLGDIFHDIITPINIKELIDLKYLVPPKYYGHKKDFRYIKTKMGEYDNKELFDAFDKSQLYGEVVSEFKRLGTGKAIVFNVNIVHSSKTCEAFRNAGYSAAHLDHETKDDERKQILSDFASGKYQILCNVSLFTEGYDLPDINTVILNRATKSKCLFTQMIGRGLRPAEGKENCIVIDHGGNVYEHGMVEDDIEYDIFKKKSKAKKQTPDEIRANAKQCPACMALVSIRCVKCPHCGYEFPLPAPVETELEEIKTVKITIPQHLRKRWSEMTDKELAEFAEIKNYKKGWIYHQKQLRKERNAAYG